MKARHIAMITLVNPGHLYPMLGVCSELVGRGYRTTYPTSHAFAEKIRQTGAEPVVFEAPEIRNAEEALQYPAPDDPRFWRIFASILCPRFLLHAAGTLAAIESFYRENPPDLVIYDWFSFAGRVLAKNLDCPAIQVWAHFAHQGSLIRENGVCFNPEPMLGFSQLVDSFMSAHGIHGKNNFWHIEKLNIYFHPKEFQFDADSFDERFCFVGPSLYRPVGAAWNNNSAGKPIVLVSESAAAKDTNFFKTCVDAFAGSKYHVVFSPGANSPPISMSTLPDNFEINKDAYNTQILPHAALTICQAGMGTALESLYYGVPLIGIPLTPYHAEVAYRVDELRMGAYLSQQELTADQLRNCAETILDDLPLLNRCKSMQSVLRNNGGAKMAADLIETFMSSKSS
jgi:MGT family glycosyltransferase